MVSENAKLAVQRIMADLLDRRGIRQEIEACDAEVREEMEETLAEIIDDTMREK